MPNDITYCINSNCPFKDCERHFEHSKKIKGMISIASLDGVCRRYLNFLLEESERSGDNA